MRSRRTLVLIITGALAIPLTSAQADVSSAKYHANQTTYGNPATSTVKPPPDGYELFFLETVGRHGSRSMTDTRAEKRAMAVWSAASRKGLLTTRGKRFDNDLREFQQ